MFSPKNMLCRSFGLSYPKGVKIIAGVCVKTN